MAGPNRIFNPVEFGLLETFYKENTVTDPFSLRHLRSFSQPSEPDSSSLVINISAAMTRHNHRTPLASYGVFFGPSNPHNLSSLIPSNHPQTLQIAELHAVQEALRAVYAHFDCSRNIKIILVSDSRYVMDGLGIWIERWRANGFKRYNERAMNEQLFCVVDNLVSALESGGARVLFWKVEKSENREAEMLAIGALSRRRGRDNS